MPPRGGGGTLAGMDDGERLHRAERFRRLPDPVLPEQTVESVDTGRLPDGGEAAERDRLLGTAG